MHLKGNKIYLTLLILSYRTQIHTETFTPVLKLEKVQVTDFTCENKNKDQNFLDFKEAMIDYWKQLTPGMIFFSFS